MSTPDSAPRNPEVTALYQRYYETARDHIARFGRSVNKHGDCAYRGENGAKCALGAIIPYDVEVKEGYGVPCPVLTGERYLAPIAGRWVAPPCSEHDIAGAKMLNDAGIPATREMQSFLYRLQTAHDQATTTEDALTRLDAVARNFGLSVAPVSE